MMCGSILCIRAQNLFGHLMSFQQASSHFCNQNTFKSLGLINFYHMLEFDQNILSE